MEKKNIMHKDKNKLINLFCEFFFEEYIAGKGN